MIGLDRIPIYAGFDLDRFHYILVYITYMCVFLGKGMILVILDILHIHNWKTKYVSLQMF